MSRDPERTVRLVADPDASAVHSDDIDSGETLDSALTGAALSARDVSAAARKSGARTRSRLTDRQNLVLKFIRDSIEQRGYPPTIREIGMRLAIKSTNGVNDHLKALERKGYLKREDMKSRALRPVDSSGRAVLQTRQDTDMVTVPILGRVAAGQPLLAVEEARDTVKVDRFMLGASGREVFALSIVGESMIEDGIHDGDYIFVKKQATANRGDIVVALIDDEATVKRYYPEGDRIRFQPANSSMAPIYVRRDQFKSTHLLGVVVGLYRKM
ncbi:MAG: transcriptional repressor LexA [Myxococcales bacterium]|nr:transcriptional repressor LexA [Myxococcales bacterium]